MKANSMRTGHIVSLTNLCLGLLLCGCTAAIDYARELYVRLDSSLGSAEITITLNNSFIETYKDRATMDVRFGP